MVWIKRKIIISYVVNQYPMVWTTRLLCEQATHGTNQFLFGVITQIVVWSHICVETRCDSHPVGVITSPVGVSIPPVWCDHYSCFSLYSCFPVMKTNVYFKWGLVIRTFDLMRFHDRKVFLRNKSIFAKTSPQWLGDTFALSSTWWPSYIFAVYAADFERLDMHHEGAGRVSSRVQRVISFFASQSLHNKKKFKKKIRRCKWRSKF